MLWEFVNFGFPLRLLLSATNVPQTNIGKPKKNGQLGRDLRMDVHFSHSCEGER